VALPAAELGDVVASEWTGLATVVDVARDIAGTVDDVFARAGDIAETLASLNPANLLPEDPLNLVLADNRFYGGAGDDVLSGDAQDDRLVGGEGDDTYVVRLDEGDDVVDERGWGLLQNAIDWIGEEVPGIGDLLDNLGGGHDVVELRAGDVGFDAAELNFSKKVGGHLAIDLGGGSLEVAGMEEADTKVETLRVVDRDGVEEFDLDGIYDALSFAPVDLEGMADGIDLADLAQPTAFDIDDFRRDGTFTDETSDIVLAELAGRAETATLFTAERIADIGGQLDDAVATVADVVGLEAPDTDYLTA